jgi:hypothetical protein
MTANNLDALIDLAADHARNMFLEHGIDDLMPTFLWVDAQGESTIAGIATDFNDWRVKDMVAAHMGAMMRDKGAVAYSFMSEAWMAHIPVADADKVENVRDRPDKIEVVVIVAHDAKGNARSRMLRMDRGEGGRVTALVEVRDDMPEAMTGRFSNLLETLQ